jgi:hypothetical protein
VTSWSEGVGGEIDAAGTVPIHFYAEGQNTFPLLLENAACLHGSYFKMLNPPSTTKFWPVT